MEEVVAALLGALAGLFCSLLAAVWHFGLQPPQPARPRCPRRLKVSASSCLVCCPCPCPCPAAAACAAEPVAGTEDLCCRREAPRNCQNCQMELEEEEKAKIQNKICCLTKKLSHVNRSLARKMGPSREDVKSTPAEPEAPASPRP